MRKLFFLVSFIIFIFLLALPCAQYACAGAGNEIVLAEVNGDIIDEGALQERIRAIHRHKPGMRPEGGAGSIKISDLVEDMIDERLMIQEAYRLQLDRDAGFAKRVDSFVTTQAVLRLRQEAVLDKISVSDDEVVAYFREHHKTDGSVADGTFEKVKKRLRKKLEKEKEKTLTDAFVGDLQGQADIWIDQELFDRLNLEKDYDGGKTVIARVNGQPIPLDDMLHDMTMAFQRRARMFSQLQDDSEREKMQRELKQAVLDRLITYEVIEQEALRRHYTSDPAFMKKVKQRKDRLLLDEFKAKIVYPLAIPTEKDLTYYYEQHTEDFKKGYEVWIGEMTFGTREEAEKILKELRQGADFEFLAAQVSERQMPKRGDVWVHAERFSPPVREALSRLKVGEISGVIADGRQIKIVKLKGKRGGEPTGFSEVAEDLKRIVGKQKFEERLAEYVAKLRESARIKINHSAVKQVGQRYWKASPAQTETPASAG
jgi:parvulin-like peptidyl-prolyl isomerase